MTYEFAEWSVVLGLIFSYFLLNITVTTGIWMSVMVSFIPLCSHLSAETAN